MVVYIGRQVAVKLPVVILVMMARGGGVGSCITHANIDKIVNSL